MLRRLLASKSGKVAIRSSLGALSHYPRLVGGVTLPPPCGSRGDLHIIAYRNADRSIIARKGQQQHQQHQHQQENNETRRSFATNKNPKKRALQEQQRRDGTLGKEQQEDHQPATAPTTNRPSSLIRTDFALESSSSSTTTQDLVLPSGYEIETVSPTNTSSVDGSDTSATASVAYVDYKELYDPKVHLPSAPQDWSEYEPATPLWEELAAQIGVQGRPVTVAEYIRQALLHPQFGYYSQPSRGEENDDDDDLFSDDDDDDDDEDVDHDDKNTNPIFGPRGDFVTAPEICQVFGESIQVWMVTQWEAMGKPKAMQWVEFGPGRGTLMADMVRFAFTHHEYNSSSTHDTNTNKLHEYGQALRVIHFIEPSHPLRMKQQASLQDQLGDLVNWKFYNNNNNNNNNVNDPESDTTVAKEWEESSVAGETATTSTKPTIHVHWHDSFGALSAMIMRRKQKTMGHSSSSSSSSSSSIEEEDVTAVVEEENDDDDDGIASMPLFVVCQEFFDALPVHAFEMTIDGWRERMVDMAIRDELLEEDDDEDLPKPAPTYQQLEGHKRPRLRIVLAPEVTPALRTLLHVDEEGKILGESNNDNNVNNNLQAEVGQVVEVCPEGILLVQDIAALLEQQGGAAIIVDYGEEGSTDSLRGFWKHKQTHFLSLPGQTDVTADVDFTALKHAVNFARPQRQQQQQAGTKTQPAGSDATTTSSSSFGHENNKNDDGREIRAYGPIAQGKFLVSMGANKRVIHCIQSDSTSDEEAQQLFYALERLVAADQMGTRYKVLAIAPERKDISGSFKVPPAGF